MKTKRNGKSGLGILAALAALIAPALAAGPAQAAAPNDFFGVAPQEGLASNDFDLMQQADVGSIRQVFNWPDIQSSVSDPCTATGGGCAWDGPDSVVGAAAARGISIVPALYGAAPGEGNPRKPPLSSAQLALWRQFVQAAVDRYGTGGEYWNGPFQAQFPGASPRFIKLWQVWNEPNSHQFFPPGGDPKKYAKLLKSSAAAIKAGDRSSKVMLGGMFGETGPKNEPINKYIASLYKVKKIEKSFDIAAIHPYSKDAKGLLKQVAGLDKAIKKAKDNAKIWVSEVGYASSGPKKIEVVTKNEKAQAKALTAAFKAFIAKRRKYGIAGVTWFSWEDSDIAGICKFCKRAGLVDLNSNPKPAYNAFAKLAK